MGIVEFDPTNYRLDYIPQRLRSLEVCVMACHSLLNAMVDVTPLAINLGSSELKEDNLRLFIDLAMDAGLVANRTLLNFLGIKLANGGLVNIEDGVTISSFGLSLVPVSTAQKILLPEIPEFHMQRFWVEALTTASKSIAHFTEKGAVISVARLGFASHATAKLVRAHFYDALGIPAPKTILPPDVEPKFGTCWDWVDPQLKIVH
jgi:hypothetical protein